MPAPIQESAANLDLSPRVFKSTAVAASPAAAAETTVCTLTCTGDIAVLSGVILIGVINFTVGASGTAVTGKIRRTDTSGQTITSTGALTTGTIAAGNLTQVACLGFDTGPTMPGQVYVLTLTVTAGSGASTVSDVALIAVVV